MSIVNIPVEVSIWLDDKKPAVVAAIMVDATKDDIVADRITFDALIDQFIEWVSVPGGEPVLDDPDRKQALALAKSFERNAKRLRELLK